MKWKGKSYKSLGNCKKLINKANLRSKCLIAYRKDSIKFKVAIATYKTAKREYKKDSVK